MKRKKMIVLAALILALAGCGTAAAAIEDHSQTETEFKMVKIDNSRNFELYQDRETGVQYIVYSDYSRGGFSWFGIVPRYNADGTLYCGK